MLRTNHQVLFGLSTLRYLGLFVEHLLVFIEAAKIRPVHMIKRSDTQTKEGTLQNLESHWKCLRLGTCLSQCLSVLIFARRTCQKHRNDASWCSCSTKKVMAVMVRLYMKIQKLMLIIMLWMMYMLQESFGRPHMNINTVYVEHHGDDYIRPNADLENRPQIRSQEQLKCMYPDFFDGIDGSKIFNITSNYTSNLSQEYKLHIK